jgi:hypothetical protein
MGPAMGPAMVNSGPARALRSACLQGGLGRRGRSCLRLLAGPVPSTAIPPPPPGHAVYL